MPKFIDWVAGRSAVTIADADEMYVRDADANVSKRITWANLKTAIFNNPTLTGNVVVPDADADGEAIAYDQAGARVADMAVRSAAPQYAYEETDQAVDNKKWRTVIGTGRFIVQGTLDDGTTGVFTPFDASRLTGITNLAGTGVTGVVVPVPTDDSHAVRQADTRTFAQMGVGQGWDYNAPGKAAFCPTASLDVRFAGAATDWSRGASQGFVAVSSVQRSWIFYVGGTAIPVLALSTDGATDATLATATVAGYNTNGGSQCVRAVWTASPAEVTFFRKAWVSMADMALDTGWTQIGSTVTAGVPSTALFSAAGTPLTVGAYSQNSAAEFVGKMYGALVKVDGVEVASPRFDQGNSGAVTDVQGNQFLQYDIAPRQDPIFTGAVVVPAATAATQAAQVSAIDAPTGSLKIGGHQIGEPAQRLTLPMTDFRVESGTPEIVTRVFGRWPGYQFDANALEKVSLITSVPDWGVNVDLYLAWVTVGTDTGDVAWQSIVYGRNSGTNLSGGTTGNLAGPGTLTAPGVSDQLVVSRLGTYTLSPDVSLIGIQRAGADAGDTCTNETVALAVILVPTGYPLT